MSWQAPHADTSFVQANRESFQAVISTPKKPKVLTAFDTIQPCDVSLLEAGTYYIPKSQPVRNKQEMESPMDYNILFEGIVLTFTLLLTLKYAVTSVGAWVSLYKDLRNV
jgi:hypothetical protein